MQIPNNSIPENVKARGLSGLVEAQSMHETPNVQLSNAMDCVSSLVRHLNELVAEIHGDADSSLKGPYPLRFESLADMLNNAPNELREMVDRGEAALAQIRQTLFNR